MWSFRSILMITASLMKASNLCPDLKYNDLKRYLRGRRIEKVKENNSILFLEIGNLSADNFKKYSTSMGRHSSPRFGQVILVSGCPVLIAFN